MAASFILTTIILFVDPIAAAFQFTQINLTEFLIAFGLAFTIIPIMEIVKLIQRSVKK